MSLTLSSRDCALLEEAKRRGLLFQASNSIGVRHCPHDPTPKQERFLAIQTLEAFYGGAAGGGKSDALLMAALQHIDRAGYAALILRRTFRDLNQPGAIMARAKEWIPHAYWNDNDKRFTFPSGATITFGYLASEDDVYQYQSAEFQFVGFDELTQFTKFQYTYLISRCRRGMGSDIPLRVRSASNPGGQGHDWVFNRFVKRENPKRPFVPAGLSDNPHIDQEAYEEALGELMGATKKQLLDGDWSRPDVPGALWKGATFDAEGFRPIYEDPAHPRYGKPVVLSKSRLNEDGSLAIPPELGIERVVVAVDPTVTDYDDEKLAEESEDGKEQRYTGDKCGIVVVGLTADNRGVVLADHTDYYSPNMWALVTAGAYRKYGANSIVVEVNQGGALVKNTLKGVASNLPIVEVRAASGKRARAEPVAALYEQGRASHAGVFDELESEMTQWDAKKPGSKSPNRVDALVWAFHGLGLCVATGAKTAKREIRTQQEED